MTTRRDEQFAEYVAARMPALRRLALLLCHDWHGADDLVQAVITKLYLRWARARSSDSIDAYVRTIMIREFLNERRGGWASRVTLTDQPPEVPAREPDRDILLDVRAALAALPPGQRAVLVLRYHCDLNVEAAARVLQCSAGTVKSQTFKALATLRRTLGPAADGELARPRHARTNAAPEEVSGDA